jgi:hypothetical protein
MVYIFCWVFLYQSGSFSAAVKFIKDSPTTRGRLGDVISVRPSFVLGSLEWVGNHGEAHQRLVIRGSTDDAVASVDLDYRDGEWFVERASVLLKQSGERIQLSNPTRP